MKKLISTLALFLMINESSAIVVAGNSCASIQSAVNRLPFRGGEVVLKAGEYICANYILINRDNVTLRGEGNATILRLADNANSPVIIMGQDIEVPTVTIRNVHVSNLEIDGNRVNQQSEYCYGKSFLRNNGISIRRCEDCSVEGVSIRSAASGGLVSELSSRRLSISNVTSSDNNFDGLAAYQTEISSFDRLKLHDNRAAGLSFDINFNNNIISNSVLSNNSKVGIFMRDSKDNIFQGIQIHNSGEHGVFLAQVDADGTKPATGNTFLAVTVTKSMGAGIRINDASCVNNSIVASQFIGNTQCIYEGASIVQSGNNICR